MNYVPSKIPQVQQFDLDSHDNEVWMVCQGCEYPILVTTLQQAVAQADLHEQEKHLVSVFEVPVEEAPGMSISA